MRTAGPLLVPLTELAAALMDADQAVNHADALLGKIDRRRLVHRLAEQQQLSRVSQPATEHAATTDAKIACLDRLAVDRQVVADLGAEADAMLGRSFTPHAISQVFERLTLATGTLEGQVTITARAHDGLSYRLGRTRWRGVYRLDGLYVVPHHDDLGIERQPEFADPREARRFRDNVRMAQQAKRLPHDARYPWDSPSG
jgi:hypothetical protein